MFFRFFMSMTPAATRAVAARISFISTSPQNEAGAYSEKGSVHHHGRDTRSIPTSAAAITASAAVSAAAAITASAYASTVPDAPGFAIDESAAATTTGRRCGPAEKGHKAYHYPQEQQESQQ